MAQSLKNIIEYKFILLGDSAVGKSAIFSRLSGKGFQYETTSTLGTEKITIDFDEVEIDKTEKVYKNFKITLFDTAGQERYRAITKTYFRDSQGIVLIYSINNSTTFEHVRMWLESIKESLNDWKKSRYMVMLVGNKYDIIEEDMEQRQVLIEEAQRICMEQGIYWGGEISAKTFSIDEIKEVFNKFMTKIYLKLKADDDSSEMNHKTQVAKKVTNLKKRKKVTLFC